MFHFFLLCSSFCLAIDWKSNSFPNFRHKINHLNSVHWIFGYDVAEWAHDGTAFHVVCLQMKRRNVFNSMLKDSFFLSIDQFQQKKKNNNSMDIVQSNELMMNGNGGNIWYRIWRKRKETLIISLIERRKKTRHEQRNIVVNQKILFHCTFHWIRDICLHQHHYPITKTTVTW